MRDELANILSNEHKNIDQSTLLKYLGKKLEYEEMHIIEQQMLKDPFVNDAVEGLEELKNKERIGLIVDGLNRDLKKRIGKKAERKKRLTLKTQWALYFCLIIFLIIIVLAYLFFVSVR